ncbi:MAG TPA: type II toxin-antitoxin system HicA family toxin [Acidimicrobiales bacterium]|nr:type II toxin-antitoxin system HicA family toxin [Acidimicrobiales bacterium]
MPGAVPVTSGAAVVRALEKVGFSVVRAAGSHRILRHPDGRSVTVPVHASRDLPKGTLRNILTITGITAEELRQLL